MNKYNHIKEVAALRRLREGESVKSATSIVEISKPTTILSSSFNTPSIIRTLPSLSPGIGFLFPASVHTGISSRGTLNSYMLTSFVPGGRFFAPRGFPTAQGFIWRRG